MKKKTDDNQDTMPDNRRTSDFDDMFSLITKNPDWRIIPLLLSGKNSSWEKAVGILQDNGVEQFGLPDVSFEHLIETRPPGTWRRSDYENNLLDKRANYLLQKHYGNHRSSYNGFLFGLRNYRIDLDSNGLSQLLLVGEKVNWASVLVLGKNWNTGPYQNLARKSLPDFSNFSETSRFGTNHVSVMSNLITSDGFLLAARRSTNVLHAPGIISNAVGGIAELKDMDADGTMDFAQSTLREAAEEIGEWFPAHIKRMVPTALAYYIDESYGVPFLMFEGHADLTFSELLELFCAESAPPTDVHEMNGEFFGISISTISESKNAIRWCREHMAEIHGGLLFAVLLMAGKSMSSEEILDCWQDGQTLSKNIRYEDLREKIEKW